MKFPHVIGIFFVNISALKIPSVVSNVTILTIVMTFPLAPSLRDCLCIFEVRRKIRIRYTTFEPAGWFRGFAVFLEQRIRLRDFGTYYVFRAARSLHVLFGAFQYPQIFVAENFGFAQTGAWDSGFLVRHKAGLRAQTELSGLSFGVNRSHQLQFPYFTVYSPTNI